MDVALNSTQSLLIAPIQTDGVSRLPAFRIEPDQLARDGSNGFVREIVDEFPDSGSVKQLPRVGKDHNFSSRPRYSAVQRGSLALPHRRGDYFDSRIDTPVSNPLRPKASCGKISAE